MSEENKFRTDAVVLASAEATPYPPQGPVNIKEGGHTTQQPTFGDLEKKFEESVLYRRFGRGIKNKHYLDLLQSWRVVKELLLTLNLPLEEVFRSPELIYQKLADDQRSLGYTKKIIRVLNAWGDFQTPRLLPIAKPSGYERERINDAFVLKCNARGTQTVSNAMTVGLLAKARRSKMRRHNYRWLFVAFYLGLRPNEVDSLSDPTKFEILEVSGRTVFKVYQSKLTKLRAADRWKLIPVELPQQRIALKYVQVGGLKRPSPTTIQKYLGKGVWTYAGRKGFTNLVMEGGYDLKAASIMLGHKSITTTEKHYSNSLEVQMNRIRQLGNKG